MSIKPPKKTGDGLTESTVIAWDDSADESDPEIAELLKEGTLEGLLESVERQCFESLGKFNFPTCYGEFMHREGEWRSVDPELFANGWSWTRSLWTIARARGLAPDSPVGFACRMLDDIRDIRAYREAGDCDRASLFTFYLGVKRAQSRIKTKHQAVHDTGISIRKPLDESREKLNASRKADQEAKRQMWQAAADPIWEKNPHLSNTAVAKLIVSKHFPNENFDTIRRLIKKVGTAG